MSPDLPGGLPDPKAAPVAPPAPPTPGRIVLYRSRTGDYDCPAMIVATVDSLNPKGVEAGNVPALEGPGYVHLVVFTPGLPNLRAAAEDFKKPPDPDGPPVSENLAGTYQEWNVPLAVPAVESSFTGGPGWQRVVEPGTWRWPERAPATPLPGSGLPSSASAPPPDIASAMEGPPDPANDSGASG